MCALAPNVIPRTVTDAEGNEVEVKSDASGPLVAQVFKTRIDPFVQKLNYIRVFSGTLATGSGMLSFDGSSSIRCPSDTSGGLDAPHPATANSPSSKQLFIILMSIDLPG